MVKCGGHKKRSDKAPKGPPQPKELAQPLMPIAQMESTLQTMESVPPVKRAFKDAGTSIEPEALEPHRGQRECTLTEKEKGLQTKKLRGLLYIFDGVYEHWKLQAKQVKRAVINQAPPEELQNKIDAIKEYLMELNDTYEEYRKVDAPTSDLRRKIDKSNQVTTNVVRNAEALIQETEGIEWPDVSLVFDTSTVSSPSIEEQTQEEEPAQQEEPKDNEAEVIATQNLLKIMAEQDQQQQKLIQMEAENLKQKEEMEKIKIEVERLEQIKMQNAAKASIRILQANSTPGNKRQQYPPQPHDHLTGPELTNSLVGVLCRCRKGPIAIMCDVERMFHQFHVRRKDQDYLRFLWWVEGNLKSPSVFRMKVHLFGAASSPGCANFGLSI